MDLFTKIVRDIPFSLSLLTRIVQAPEFSMVPTRIPPSTTATQDPFQPVLAPQPLAGAILPCPQRGLIENARLPSLSPSWDSWDDCCIGSSCMDSAPTPSNDQPEPRNHAVIFPHPSSLLPLAQDPSASYGSPRLGLAPRDWSDVKPDSATGVSNGVYLCYPRVNFL